MNPDEEYLKMTDQDRNVLTDFLALSPSQREKHLKKKPRVYLSNLALLCAAKAEHEQCEKEESQVGYQRACDKLEEHEEQEKRHLEQAAALEDGWNRLKNENETMVKIVTAAIASRNLHVIAGEAVIEAMNADVTLASFGTMYSSERSA